MMPIENRQSGRTTRIVDFVIEQLHSVGQCIVTDHTVFEYPGRVKNNSIKEFVDKVKRRIQFQTNGKKSCSGKIKKVDNIKIVHFKIK